MKRKPSPGQTDFHYAAETPAIVETPSGKRANALGGADWTKYSVSVWSDIRFNAEERALKHPAMFPSMLAERLIRCFAAEKDRYILDPFMGSGSTILAAARLGKIGIGFELYDAFISLARSRLHQTDLFNNTLEEPKIYQADARSMSTVLEANSVDLCITSPPYWNILERKRTADYKPTESYGESDTDLGRTSSYTDFISELREVFAGVLTVLKPGKFCVVNVMDLRKKDQFFPFHSDVAGMLSQLGFSLEDIIIWDRRADYNNLRALGYPYVFRVNKVHEYLMLFKKPIQAT
jgi:DNA modification methylase